MPPYIMTRRMSKCCVLVRHVKQAIHSSKYYNICGIHRMSTEDMLLLMPYNTARLVQLKAMLM